MTVRAIRAAALTLALAGCTVGPDFKPPAADVPPGWAGTKASGPASAATEAPVENLAWWQAFGDAELTSLVTRAAAANLDVRQAALRVVEARAQRAVTGAAQWPTLSASAGYTRERLSEKSAAGSLLGSLGGGAPGGLASGGLSGRTSGFSNPFDQYQYGLDASWEVDLFGRIARTVEAADADTEAAVEDRRSVLLSLLGDVALSYLDLRGTQRRQAVLAENLASQREILELTRYRQAAGLGTDLDVADAAAVVASTEAELPTLDSEATQDIDRLSLLLALKPGALAAELKPAAPLPALPATVAVGLPADLARRRPDIRRAEAELHAATALEAAAVADLFPRLTLSAGAGLQAERFASLSDWASRFASLGPSLELPILDGGRRRATIDLENARTREAALGYERTVLAALGEVEDGLAAYGDEQRRKAALDGAVRRYRDALSLARQRYQSGVTSFLDVLDAERSLQQAELSLATSATGEAADLVTLYKALGGGWQIAEAAGGEPAR